MTQPSVDPETPDADKLRLPTLTAYWKDQGLLSKILDNNKPLLSMESAGLGQWFDQVLGGGIQPGEVMAIGSAGAGVGKTALVHQMADGWAESSGLALHGGDGQRKPRVTPVLYVTEMSVSSLTIRTLARRAEIPGKILRAPSHFGEEVARRATKAAIEAAQLFRFATDFLTPVDRSVAIGDGAAAVQKLGDYAARIRDEWSTRADVGAMVLIIDPLHRLLQIGAEETGALTDILGAILAITQKRELVTIFTSDTTKSAAGARNASGNGDAPPPDLEQEAEQAFRGNYQLLHVPDHVLAVRTLDPEKARHQALLEQADGGRIRQAFDGRGQQSGEWATVFADLPTPKLRWGKVGDRPAFWYDRAIFRFVPIPRPALPALRTASLTTTPRSNGKDFID